MTKPLEGLRVIELGQLIAGPFAGKMLAEFGAQVIKIEAPGSGDPLRKWRMLHEGKSVWWAAQSRNKQSVTLDLRAPEGQELIRTLVRESDVLIENFRPGTLEGWGLGWEVLHEINPRLVMLPAAGILGVRRGARSGRQQPAGDRADQCLSLRRRQVRPHRR